MSPPTPAVSATAPSTTALPRAVWIGFGALGLVTAALAGAPVMRSVAPSTTVYTANSSLGTPMVEVPAAKTASTSTTHIPPSRPATSSGSGNTSA